MSLSDQSQQWYPTSVQVTVLQARSLRIKGKNGTNDAYAIMQVAKDKFATSVAEKSVAPVWKEEATFELPLFHNGNTEKCTLHVHVMHRALVGSDKLLGHAIINLLELSEVKSRNKTEWHKLLDKAGKPDKDRGEVLVDIQFMKNNLTASMFDLSATDKPRSRLGKFKDKVRGKKKEGLSDSASAVVPSFTQVLTDSEGEGEGEGGADKEEKKKKNKLKSLFSPKSNLQRHGLSQSMSVLGPLPEKDSSLSGSPSGLNEDSSEGKNKFKFLTHKRTGSSDSKASQGSLSLGRSKIHAPLAEQSNLCINGSHLYTEHPHPRSARTGSTFSLASSGHGSMEDLRRAQGRKSSSTSMDSLTAPKQPSPWAEGESSRAEEDEEEEEEERVKMDEMKRKEEQERKKLEEERMRKEEQEKRRIGKEVERLRFEEEEKTRKEEQENRKRMEEEKIRVEEESRMMEERKRRLKEEGEERVKKKEQEMMGLQEEKEERMRREEHERRKREDRLRKEEDERKMREEEERIKEEEERIRREQEEEMQRREERQRKMREEEERLRMEEEMREEEVRVKREQDRLREEERRVREEEERVRKAEEEDRLRAEMGIKRTEEEERIKREEEDRLRKEEEESKIRKQEERIRRLEEEMLRKDEEERKIREEEERIRRLEEKMLRKEEEERTIREEEERIRRFEEEMLRKDEEERKIREEEERIRRLEEERLRKEEEERKIGEEEERIRRLEEERLRKDEERKIREEEERIRRLEEERLRKEEAETMRLEEERGNEQERSDKEQKERFRVEEENMKTGELRQEEKRRNAQMEEAQRREEARAPLEEVEKQMEQYSEATVTVCNNPFEEVSPTSSFDDSSSNNLFEENPMTTTGPISCRINKVSAVKPRPHPVKPLSSLENQPASNIHEGQAGKSTGVLGGLQEKIKVKDTEVKGPYSQLTQEELISLVLKQQEQLSKRDDKIKELEQYIDNLLVRIIEEQPSILMTMNSLK
ncbi:rab11 family-interacting protein 1 isoform X3 [Oncorhynchus kisutch]|uniref:Rab11 family-interacting protein 1 n=1 Tax=Oncorhynchus kisutch TaxID=8019 RepID=A0A8C7FA86_ONCKI|nr:rab11 family-interacting protein 1 isoform X3 [Oncorhynchus kisutch]